MSAYHVVDTPKISVPIWLFIKPFLKHRHIPQSVEMYFVRLFCLGGHIHGILQSFNLTSST